MEVMNWKKLLNEKSTMAFQGSWDTKNAFLTHLQEVEEFSPFFSVEKKHTLKLYISYSKKVISNWDRYLNKEMLFVLLDESKKTVSIFLSLLKSLEDYFSHIRVVNVFIRRFECSFLPSDSETDIPIDYVKEMTLHFSKKAEEASVPKPDDFSPSFFLFGNGPFRKIYLDSISAFKDGLSIKIINRLSNVSTRISDLERKFPENDFSSPFSALEFWNKYKKTFQYFRINKGIKAQNSDQRSIFEKNFDSICFNSHLRKMQNKAQVFPLSKTDFVRTRLTHSIEVMNVCERLGNDLISIIAKKYSEKNKKMTEYKLSQIFKKENINCIPTILKTAALIHDIGNPPFGHLGEDVIKDWFTTNLDFFFLDRGNNSFGDKRKAEVSFSHGNITVLTSRERVIEYISEIFDGTEFLSDFKRFDGNAQALRVLTEIEKKVVGSDLDFSYPLLSTIMKYPDGFDGTKKGYFFPQTILYNDIQKNLGTTNRRHPLCFVLEAADDICYLCSDLEDAGKKELIDPRCILNVLMGIPKNSPDETDDNFIKSMNDLKTILDDYKDKKNDVVVQFICRKIKGYLIVKAKQAFEKNYGEIMTGTFSKNLLKDTPTSSAIYDAIKQDLLKNKLWYCDEIIKSKTICYRVLNDILSFSVPNILNSKMDIGSEQQWCIPSDSKEVPNFHMSDNPNYLVTRLIPKEYRELYIESVLSNSKNAFSCSRANKKMNDEQKNIYFKLLLITDWVSGMTDYMALHTHDLLFSKTDL